MSSIAQSTSAEMRGDEMALASSPAPRALIVLSVVTVLALLFGAYLALVYANTDITQGAAQRIFYFHMPAFFGAFTAFSATVYGGIRYLRSREVKWDVLAYSGVEIGVSLSLVNLITGSIWAKPIWNDWWTWDARLTSSAIMVLTYLAYLMFRSSIENPDTRRRFASVYGIVAISTVLLTLFIIRIVPDTIHPTIIGPSPQNAEGTFEATSNVAAALLPNLFTWFLLVPITLMWWRVRLEERIEAIQQRKLEALSQN